MSDPFGIVLSKDVMVTMRDGIRLATDVYRPGRDGELVEGRYPTIVCLTPYDKTERRYTEIADFFVPHGYAVVLQDMRDRHRSEGTKEYFHSATPHTGEDGYDTIEWIAAQPWSNGRTGMVGSSYAAITQIRTALERPPHLTAIWPDVSPTNTYHHQTREGGAMQLHMFWALYIHAADAQDVTGDWEKQREVWDDLRNLRQLFWDFPWKKGELALRHVPALDQTLEDYTTRGAYDEFWAKKENDFTRFWHEHADIPVTMSTGWYDGFPHADTEYFAAMAAQNTSPQRLIVGPWSHVGMRGDVTYTLDVDFGPDSRWGVQRYFDEQLAYLRPVAPGERQSGASRAGRAPVEDLRHGRRQRAQDAARQARPRRPVARRGRVAARPDAADGLLPPRRRVAPARAAARGRRAAARFTYDPDDPVPTIGGLYCAVGELPSEGTDIEPMWARLLNPALRLRNIMTPGPADQKESAEYFTAREPYQRLSERPDVLVYQTEPLEEAVEVTGPVEVELWIASSAVDTDFTAKLVDVHPPNEDYPDGYDMLVNDSIIRTRYREGFDREVMMEPGTPYTGEDRAAADEQPLRPRPPDPRRCLIVELPRLERNPNTGEPSGRHTRTVVAEQTVFADAGRPSHVVLPLIAG